MLLSNGEQIITIPEFAGRRNIPLHKAWRLAREVYPPDVAPREGRRRFINWTRYERMLAAGGIGLEERRQRDAEARA